MSGEWKSIYVAGKMQDDDWRRHLFDDSGYENSHPHKCNPVIDFDTSFNDEPWPEYGTTICGLRYTGPFFADNVGGHGFSGYEDGHGANVSIYNLDKQKHQQIEVQQWCFDAIKRADLFVAWIDCLDCYGTIAEVGYAKALGKTVLIAGPRRYRDLWFVYTMADILHLYDNVSTPGPLEDSIAYELNRNKRYSRHFDSPIETAFWKQWMSFRSHTFSDEDFLQLEPQYQIDRYRVDFANVETKTAVELDGHATHSSPDAIAHDRKRQREIEALGWHVIRFGGKEIYQDAEKCVQEVWFLLHKRYDLAEEKGKE